MKFERYFDENTTEREGRNGRIYAGVVGWRWAVTDDNGTLLESGFRTKAEAKQEAAKWYAASKEQSR